jgi:hypothetical protein
MHEDSMSEELVFDHTNALDEQDGPQRRHVGARMEAGESRANRGQTSAVDPARSGWILASSFIALGSLLTELAPVVFGTGAEARLDWSLGYVTMKFILLPLASALIIGCFLVGFASQRSVTAAAAIAGAVAILYLVQLALWPLFWFV